MKIAHIASRGDRKGGGVSEAMLSLGEVLAERKNEVEFYARVDPKERLRPTLPTRATSLWEISSAVRTGCADLLHVHGLWDPFLAVAQATARAKPLPTVLSPHGMLTDWALRQGARRKRIALATYEKRNVNQARCLHALTRSEAIALKERFPTKSIAVIPNGIQLPPLNLLQLKRKKQVLFLGRVHRKKGIIPLLQAFSLVMDTVEGRDWKVVIAGWDDDGHLAEVERAIDRLGQNERVRLCGPVFGAEKARLLSESGAFALTSHSEGLPVAVLEAAAFGLPVLLSPDCNLADFQSYGAGIETPADPESIAAGLAQFLSMPCTARTDMGTRGRALVAQRYSWPQIAERFEELYNWIVSDGKSPDFVF